MTVMVTGHDGHGRAQVMIDETCGNVQSRRQGHHFCVVWTTDTIPVINDGSEDGAQREVGTTLPGGTVFRRFILKALAFFNFFRLYPRPDPQLLPSKTAPRPAIHSAPQRGPAGIAGGRKAAWVGRSRTAPGSRKATGLLSAAGRAPITDPTGGGHGFGDGP
jgi:hypothetical protein